MGLTNVLERAIHMLSSPNKPERLEAVRELIRVCESQDLVDFERVHAALRSRTSFFPRVEQDREVFAYLISATKRVARLRTRAVGFRVARPSTIEDHTVDLSAVLTWIWDSSNIYGTREEFDSSVDGASAGLLGVFALQFSTSEIRNGGFHQYFSNPTGILYPDAVEALRRLACPETAKVFLTAGSLFRDGVVPTDRDARAAALARVPRESLEACSHHFYDLDEDWESAARAYVTRNPDEFYQSAPSTEHT